MPKVLMVVADGAPGGGTTAVLGLCQDLAHGGWTPVLTIQADSYGLESGRRLGVETHGVDFFRSRVDPWIPSHLARVLSDVKPDLIHIHGARAGYPFCSMRLRRIGVPVVYSVQGYHFLKKPWARRTLGRMAERQIGHRANHVIFVSENDRTIASRLRLLPSIGGRSTIIYNSIDPSELDRVIPRKDVHDVVFVGRFVEQKNPRFPVDVMVALGNKKVRLLMVGGGEMEADVRAYATERGVADQITFTGALSRAEALSALRSAKLFLFPSRWEGLPIAPIEAMYYRLPIVGSKIGGTEEVVAHGVTGLLIDRFNAELYARAIRDLLADDDRRESMAAAGRQRVRSMFLRSSCTERHRELYERLL